MIELVYSREPGAADEYGRCVIAVAPTPASSASFPRNTASIRC
jgi:hypothetical protein